VIVFQWSHVGSAIVVVTVSKQTPGDDDNNEEMDLDVSLNPKKVIKSRKTGGSG